MRAARLAAIAVAVAMLGYRLVGLGDAPFVRDEPFFLEAARQELATGRWVLGSPIIGGQGIPYGPSVMWFYGAVQAVLGPSPVGCIGAMCLLCSLAYLSLAWALTRALRRDAFFFATLLAFMASSPYGFFWSRFAWDQLVYALSPIAIALCCTPALSWKRGLVLGAVLGLAVSSHLMVVPLALVLALVLMAEHRREPGVLVRMGGAALAAALVVNAPYLVFLARAQTTPGTAVEESHHVLTRALEPARVASSWGISYFFDGDWPRVLAALGLERAYGALAIASVVACAGLALAGVVLLARSAERVQRRLGILAAATTLGYALFYAAKRLPLEPHYQFPTAWLVPVGVAGALAGLPARRASYALVWTLALAQLAFVVGATRELHARTGTRGIHLGPPVSHQADLVRAACGRIAPGQTLELVNRTNVFRGSLEYLARVEPACAERTVRVCRTACPTSPRADLRLGLGYRDEVGGALAVTDTTPAP